MQTNEVIKSRFFKIGFLIVLILGLFYLTIRLLFFEIDPVLPFIEKIFDGWLALCGILANHAFTLFNQEFYIDKHQLFFNDLLLYEFSNSFLMKKLFFGVFIFIWIFPVKIYHKLFGSFLFLFLHWIFISLDMFVLANLFALDGSNSESAYWISRTPGVMFIVTFFVVWVLIFKDNIYQRLKQFNIDIDFIDRKLPDLFVIMYLYGFIGNFLLGWYDYKGWINFLFLTSQNILTWMNYEANVYETYLLGENGGIYMEKGCLGFATMMLFAAIVYLTSEKGKARWIYMISGLIFLNIVNITRFVFLFIHVQKNDGYARSIDVHDMYNLVLYGVVFVLWIIWFEFFALKSLNTENKADQKT